ncbi:Acetyltransferases [Aquiflexum balticum DSM 16537]|uniref:Acetyltransferases n=1 Tax=Aquiflexum balticum DSM 16537 TaxID=758820 RepID=A0A1W2H0J7_9BACT|nr:GNAT family N-acetyltransferase [Aquiflexum balticum]SMD42419.1 Acetyltransferases [Aquiflexum balticum DSM 16537]
MKICKLGKSHKKNEFDCGKRSLNDYLAKIAKQDVEKNVAVCYILEGEENKVIGYYTLSSGSIPKEEIPDNVSKKLPRYSDIPFAAIGRLAIDKNYQGKGLGGYLLVEAFTEILKVSEVLGIAGVFVDPIDNAAIKFYELYGFIKLNTSDRMFLPMATIRELLKD